MPLAIEMPSTLLQWLDGCDDPCEAITTEPATQETRDRRIQDQLPPTKWHRIDQQFIETGDRSRTPAGPRQGFSISIVTSEGHWLEHPAGRKLQASDVELKGDSHSLDQKVQQPNEPSTNDGDVATIDRKQIAQKLIASTKQQSKMLAMNALLSAVS